jgi:hypothetical protein
MSQETTFGPTYVESRDGARIHHQMDAIHEYIRDGHWFTLDEVEDVLDYPQASISAQLRHLRKPQFGGHTIEKRYVGDGLWEYSYAPSTL